VSGQIAEALNETPLFLSEKLSLPVWVARDVSFCRGGQRRDRCTRVDLIHCSQDTTGEEVRLEASPALPELDPLLPPDQAGRSWLGYAEQLQSSRLPNVLINVLKLATTVGIILRPVVYWVPAYVALTLPLRALSTGFAMAKSGASHLGTSASVRGAALNRVASHWRTSAVFDGGVKRERKLSDQQESVPGRK
jgi:hypothetical protein